MAVVNTHLKYKNVTDPELLLPKEKERLDVWWNKVFKTNRYPVLMSLVCPVSAFLQNQWWKVHSAW